MTKLEDLLTVQDAADLSGYHPERIRELIRDGIIDALKFGRVWAVNKYSLQAFLDSKVNTGKKRGRKQKN